MPRTVARRHTNTTALPQWILPQLTQLVDAAPDGDGWLHEIKYDGYRMHVRLDRERPINGQPAGDRLAVRQSETKPIAKRLCDPYGPRTRWLKIKNRDYTQAEGRGELFNRATAGKRPAG